MREARDRLRNVVVAARVHRATGETADERRVLVRHHASGRLADGAVGPGGQAAVRRRDGSAEGDAQRGREFRRVVRSGRLDQLGTLLGRGGERGRARQAGVQRRGRRGHARFRRRGHRLGVPEAGRGPTEPGRAGAGTAVSVRPRQTGVGGRAVQRVHDARLGRARLGAARRLDRRHDLRLLRVVERGGGPERAAALWRAPQLRAHAQRRVDAQQVRGGLVATGQDRDGTAVLRPVLVEDGAGPGPG